MTATDNAARHNLRREGREPVHTPEIFIFLIPSHTNIHAKDLGVSTVLANFEAAKDDGNSSLTIKKNYQTNNQTS